ncbi:hypothetical protein ACFSO7_00440 [Bacillus sp. CGMCC 1.16607]|uniref:hypothetical protein n=1 Tax=Bacillus sp. CGMCC 1.16607 TaxID=3351842 RepID=UPI00363F49AC
MNKRVILMGLLTVMLTACGTKTSWEKEEIIEVSDRIVTDDVKVEWELDADQAPNHEKLIRLKITNNDEPINDFEVNHEKLLHLIVVSKDLSYFNHIHPEYKGNGVFEIVNEFPAGGEYRMVADFKPKNGSSMSKMEWVNIEGASAQPVAITVDESLEKTINGKKVTLTINPQIEAKKELSLKFTLTDEINQPISDLEPYLGSIGHVVILSENGERYLHVHALEDQGSGPEAVFETNFPESGVYKIWGQFQKDGQVFTVPYVVNVP